MVRTVSSLSRLHVAHRLTDPKAMALVDCEGSYRYAFQVYKPANAVSQSIQDAVTLWLAEDQSAHRAKQDDKWADYQLPMSVERRMKEMLERHENA